jgi:hypothetical protein
MRLRRSLAGLAVLSAAAAALVVTATAAVPVAAREPADRPLPGPGRVLGRGQVPWDQVGDGWYLAAVQQGRRGADGLVRPQRQRLDLVNPRGGRYRLFRAPVGKAHGAFQLVDWAEDGEALLSVDAGMPGSRAVVVDLHTGTAREVALPASVSDIAFGRGGRLVGTTYGDGRPDGRRLVAVDWSGRLRTLATGIGATVLPSEDGSLLVSGPVTARGRSLRVLDGVSGEPVGEVATPLSCVPSRWWEPGVVTARCWGNRQRLEVWLVPLDGSAPTQLSTYHGRRSDDLGDLDARELGGRTYLQASGPCGYTFLARQEADGTATRVDVPGSAGSVRLVDATDSALVIEHAVSCDGGGTRAELALFDPVTSAEQVLTTLPEDQQLGRVLPYGERGALGW